jgi:cytochrome c556
VRAALAGLLLVLAAACGPPRQVLYGQQSASDAPAARHAVESQRLREAMGRLDRLRAERLPTEMDLEGQRLARAEDVAAAAREMAAAAAAIPDVLTDVEMAEPARREFLRLAAELGQRAGRLAEGAPELSPEDLDGQLQQIDNVCAECHSRFRVLPLVERR